MARIAPMLRGREISFPLEELGGYIGPHFEFSTIVDRRVRAELSRATFISLGLTMGVEF